jgi:hypothetical protein
MRTFRCTCDNSLFFDNSVCLRCNHEVGFCPVCDALQPLLPQPEGGFRCGNPACAAALVKCENYKTHNVCNRCARVPVKAAAEAPSVNAASPSASAPEPIFCDYCEFNDTIPDLNVPGHAEKWYRLESAKRRLLYELELLGLPLRLPESDPRPKLQFRFKADVEPKKILWFAMGKKEQVFTGHASGVITINIREANDAEREKLRVGFGEAHRTLIGHFRHEIAHYYWEILVLGRDEARCVEVFGNHEKPTYGEALDAYYKKGPPGDWRNRFVSAYSTMHPWEDFAETFATYLDMVSVLDTATHAEFIRVRPRFGDFDAMIAQYKTLGIGMNEINRSMGLLDLVPEVFVEPVREKMRYVHDLISAAATPA